MISLKRPWEEGFGNLAHGGAEFSDLLLGMVILTQLEEMDEIVQVAVDVDLGENAHRKNHSGELFGHALFHQVLVRGVGLVVEIFHLFGERLVV